MIIWGRSPVTEFAQQTPEGRGVFFISKVKALIGIDLKSVDVSALKVSDLLWEQGTLIVSGKNRRGTRLPLPQDAGEAILHYLRHRQPHKVSDSVFITVTPPFVPISRHVIRRVVMAALRRAGISAPTQGAHLLRHSVATAPPARRRIAVRHWRAAAPRFDRDHHPLRQS